MAELTNTQIAALHELWQAWKRVDEGQAVEFAEWRQWRTRQALVDAGYAVRVDGGYSLTPKAHDTAKRLIWTPYAPTTEPSSKETE